MENGVPPHFHKIDRVSEEDLIPNGKIYAALPTTGLEGETAVVLSGGLYTFYKFLDGSWRQISGSAVDDATLPTSDITTNNSSTLKHGFLKKLSGSATDFMNGLGNWVSVVGVLLGTASAGQYSSQEFDVGNATGTKTIDWSNGNVQYVTLTGNCTFTFSNPLSGTRVTLDVAGAFTPTWPSNVRWPSGTVPTVTATAGKKDIYAFKYSAKESLYDGMASLNISTT